MQPPHTDTHQDRNLNHALLLRDKPPCAAPDRDLARQALPQRALTQRALHQHPLPQRAPTLPALCAALSCALLLSACKEPPPPPAEPATPIVQGGQLRFPPGHPQLALLTTTAAAPPGRLMVDLPARLVWDEEHTQRIVPAFAGRVTSIDADLGRQVAPGAVLAHLASPDFGSAQADAAKARADAAYTQKALTRQRELFDAGVTAKKEFEQAEADSQRAAAELARAQSRVSAYSGAAVKDNEHGVNQQLTLRASMGGVVVERNINPGQELRPDQAGPGVPPMFVVSDPRMLWVQIDARDNEVGTLRPGAVFTLTVPSLGDRAFEGRVTAVSDFIDPATRTVKIRGVVDNHERLLRAEMLATARFERTQGAGVVVPASAIALRGAQHSVFVQTAAGVFEPREVKLGYQGPTQALVSSGLEVGERVVSDNLLLLSRQFRLAQDEAPVTAPVTAPAAAPAASGAAMAAVADKATAGKTAR